MSTLSRKNIYILAIFFIIAISITTSHIELEHRENINLQTQNNIEDLDDYKEIEVLYPLEIKNYQNDNKTIKYSYKIKINNISGAYKYRYKDKEGYLVFTANGESEFQLESNESIIIYDLPEHLEYEVEQLTDVKDKYTTKVNKVSTNKATGNITATSEIAFDNETIIKDIKPDHQEENPYTKDSYYFVIIILAFAILIGHIGKSYKIKRFD